MPAEWIAKRFAGCCIPQPHCVIPAGDGNDPTVWTKCQPSHIILVSLKRFSDGLARDWIPQPHGAIVATAGEDLAVRTERDSLDIITMILVGLTDGLAGCYVP